MLNRECRCSFFSLLRQYQQLICLYLGNIAFDALFVGVVAIDEFAFDGYFSTFYKVFFGNLCQLTPGDYIMPLSIGYFFTFGIFVIFAVATFRWATFFPSPIVLISGACPRLPMICT